MLIELNLRIQIIRFKIKEYPCSDTHCPCWINWTKFNKFIEPFETVLRNNKISLWILCRYLNRWILLDYRCFLDVLNEIREISFLIIESSIGVLIFPNGFISNQKRHRPYCFLKWVIHVLPICRHTIISRIIL